MKGVIMTIIGFAIAIALVVSVIIPLSETTKGRGDNAKNMMSNIVTDINSLSSTTPTVE
jgi:hypothetical protein